MLLFDPVCCFWPWIAKKKIWPSVELYSRVKIFDIEPKILTSHPLCINNYFNNPSANINLNQGLSSIRTANFREWKMTYLLLKIYPSNNLSDSEKIPPIVFSVSLDQCKWLFKHIRTHVSNVNFQIFLYIPTRLNSVKSYV